MGFKEIINELQAILDSKKSRQLKRIKAVKELVERLEIKLAKFERKLEEAETNKEKKKIKRRIRVCKAQIKNGREAMETLANEPEEE